LIEEKSEKIYLYLKMTSKYVNAEVNISISQKEKIKNALHSGAESVTIKLKPEDIGGNDLKAVTKTV